ncbi:AAA family ATPase [Effusibacillus pohliae]|uniref:AAA family ATPase n=1 Tax=Effusibacillus pohliae TaxID=232270 RepID=UPI000362E53A|nr:AAA family ATPase [Effusibacillus pohliae]
MRTVKVTVEKDHWLAALRALFAGVWAARPDRMIRLRFDSIHDLLILIDEDADSSCKISLPMRQEAACSRLECLVPAGKLEPLNQLFQSGKGVVTVTCRLTTLSFQLGNKRFHVPNRIVGGLPAEKKQSAAVDSLDGPPEEGIGFAIPDPQDRVVRFMLANTRLLLDAVESCKSSAVRMQIGDGVVRIQMLEFPVQSRAAANYLLPGEVFYNRLFQMPEGVIVNAAIGSRLLSFSSVAAGVQREITIKPYPSTTLYITKSDFAKKPGHEDSLWTNVSMLTDKERRRLKIFDNQPTASNLQEQAPVSDGPQRDAEEVRFRPDPERPLGDAIEMEYLPITEAPSGDISKVPEPATELESPDELGDPAAASPHHTTGAKRLFEVEPGEEPLPETAESALESLEKLPGLTLVKKQIREIAQFAAFRQRRAEALGIPANPLTLHMAFLGNPGTGKTMAARMLGKIFKELGLLAKGHVVEVDRQSLVGAYMGQTEANLRKCVKRAIGGILLIDEAYALYKKDSGKDFGLNVIHGLVKVMEDCRDRLVVILAGYKQEMQELLNANPGLRERIPFHLEFPDFTEEELLQIGEYLALQDHYVLADDAKEALIRQAMRQKIDETFGNARTVRNLIEKAKIRHAVRAIAGEPSEAAYTTLTAADFADVDEESKSDSLGSVLAELDQLVGLERVKEWVRQIVDMLHLEQKRRQYGLTDEPITLHMAFTGNPGTGKTTVARLLGRILRHMGLLPKGHFVEASRKDLVAGYIGQTATKTADKIKEALGGVLFIDEAYALAGRGREDFGQEAIATLIKEMEDKKGRLTVILAGYPQEMEALFRLNPGLKSRVRFTIEFPDYTASELVEIVKRKAEATRYRLSEAAEEKLWGYFLRQCLASGGDFGNGRLAETIFEQAKMRMSRRISRLLGETKPELLCTITEEDIETD